jgi:DNA-binding response OmpR family regulator
MTAPALKARAVAVAAPASTSAVRRVVLGVRMICPSSWGRLPGPSHSPSRRAAQMPCAPCGDGVEVLAPRRATVTVAGSRRDNGRVPTVLVVEDERDLRDLLRRYLERAGHAVLTAATGAEGLAMIADAAVDLLVLDLGLPDIDGLEVLDEASTLRVPVLVLTARSAVEDRITGLERGAADYVTKPFSPREVVLRVAAILGRGPAAPESRVRTYGGGRLRIDEERHEATLDGSLLDLTPTEWGLLVALADTPGRVHSRYELVNRVRGYEFAGYERTIDSHIKNLRHELGGAGAQIVQTVVGVGYRLGWGRDR